MNLNTNTAIAKWIEKSIPDYYTLFIRAYIPYNAWYMKNFYDENTRKTDKDILSYISTNSNVFKDRIEMLLNHDNEESQKFKILISELNYQLEQTPIPDSEERITFSHICISDNSSAGQNGVTVSGNNNSFVVKGQKKLTPRKCWEFEVIDTSNNNRTISIITLQKCSISELHSNSDYNLLNRTYKTTVDKCLNEIDPRKKVSIVVKRNEPNICIDKKKKLYFTDVIGDVSKAIMILLYELRCKLFHGEIEPTLKNMGVYEWAFKIQDMLNKSLQ